MRRVLPVLDGPEGLIPIGADPTTHRRILRRDVDRRIAIGGVAVSLVFALALVVTFVLICVAFLRRGL